ncbi:MAG: M56 family metallopeptidase [Erythrobacter sp.]
MTSWLFETLIWTAVLIAAVLMVRRPVARWFGPQFAYALWLIPAIRLVLPPIELPAWMKPSQSLSQSMPFAGESVDPSAAALEELQFLNLNPANPVATTDGPVGVEAAAPDGTAPITPSLNVDMETLIHVGTQIGIAVWLIGAAIFLYIRFGHYFRLRNDLLTDAIEVGRDGPIRLIETPGTDAPLAFGVIDKVVALPIGFLAQPDRVARDLALAHELAHHRGRDLLINVAVQPLFALHWFNPLGRYGWLALRRDQEAACDARVLAAQPATKRAAYADLIVSFAAGQNTAPHCAIAAPMACPVLGEKSIIHRLRSLNMNNTSHTRRLTGRIMLGAAVLALPLTASISYAASELPAEPAPPAPPSAPSASSFGIAPPAPPAPPVAPLAPGDAPTVQSATIITVDPDTGETRDVVREESVIVITDDEREELEERTERRIETIRMSYSDGVMTEEQMEEIMAEVRMGLEEANEALENVPALIEEAMAEAEGAEGRTIVTMSCDNSTDEVATTTENADGTRTVMLCQARVMAHALEGLKEAREQIASSDEMSAQMRERIVRQLDQQIEEWNANVSRSQS